MNKLQGRFIVALLCFIGGSYKMCARKSIAQECSEAQQRVAFSTTISDTTKATKIDSIARHYNPLLSENNP